MIPCEDFLKWLAARGVDFYAGVPDSLLKPVCFYLADHAGDKHVVAANEGGAVALACGYHLATGKVPLVYMQNSGQGNTINPLLSLADPDVYSIPMLLLIGWRGEPGTKDEPQHVKQGKVTVGLLEEMGIPWRVLEAEPDAARRSVDELVAIAAAENRPVALLVRKGTFASYTAKDQPSGDFEMSREKAIELVAAQLGDRDAIVSTTGHISRERIPGAQRPRPPAGVLDGRRDGARLADRDGHRSGQARATGVLPRRRRCHADAHGRHCDCRCV